jgi:hypothetical protein
MFGKGCPFPDAVLVIGCVTFVKLGSNFAEIPFF